MQIIFVRNVSSSGFNRFLVEKSIEIVSRTLHITRNISIHPDEESEYSMRQNKLVSAFYKFKNLTINAC
jgi:hypothetical protein